VCRRAYRRPDTRSRNTYQTEPISDPATGWAFAILIAARHWTQQVIWNLRDKNALKSGLKPEVLSALAAGRRPPNMTEDEATVYDFCTELERNHSVSDPTYARMLSRFGERGIAEATLIQGEYTIMSMFMNVARTPLDPGTPPPLKPFPR
jgi:4-carboxymuconolactone decarboxylase